MGRSKNDPHKRNQTRESEVPIISIDYSFLTDEESLQSMPTLNMIDRHTNYFHCEIVPRKGADQHAATTLKNFIENTGYTKIILKSDQESSILALIALVKSQTRIQLIPEQSPAYDHASNGLIEHAICKSTAQQRTLRTALEINTAQSLEGNWDTVPWLVRHSGNILSWQPRDDSGRSPYHLLRGRQFNQKLAEFGETVYFLECCEVNGIKFENRWSIGVWLGICDTSNESIIGLPTGIVKSRTWKPIADSKERWNAERIKNITGTPWEPNPGVNSIRIRTKVYIPQQQYLEHLHLTRNQRFEALPSAVMTSSDMDTLKDAQDAEQLTLEVPYNTTTTNAETDSNKSSPTTTIPESKELNNEELDSIKLNREYSMTIH